METGNIRRQFVHDALKAAVAVGILILIGVVLAAGVFGADYGVRKASAQTKSEIEGILASYGLSEEQKEELYQEILKRLKEQLASGAISYEGAFTKEDAEKLKTELAGMLTEEQSAYVTDDELRKITNDILKTFEKESLSREELVQRINTIYELQETRKEEQAAADAERESQFAAKLETLQKMLEENFEKKTEIVRDTLTDQMQIHTKEIEQIKENSSQDAAALTQENEARKLQYEQLCAQLKMVNESLMTQLAGMDGHFAEQLAGMDNRIKEQAAGTDSRFALQEERLNQRDEAVDNRFAEQTTEMDNRFTEQTTEMDNRFTEQAAGTDSRFALQEERLNQRDEAVDNRFAEQTTEMDNRFAEQTTEMDNRFAEQTTEMDSRFAEQSAGVDSRFTTLEMEMKAQLTALDGRFLQLIQTMKDELTGQISSLLARVAKNETSIQEVFQLVSNGKSLIASAITDEGIGTAKDAAFDVMAANIRKLSAQKYNAGVDAAEMVADSILNTGECEFQNDWSYNGYTAPKGGHCWLVGYFLVGGNGGTDGNDINVDVWIEKNGKRIYDNGVHSYIPGTGSNSYIFYVQQQIDVAKGERFLTGFHIKSGHDEEGKRGDTGDVKRISLCLLYPKGDYQSVTGMQESRMTRAALPMQNFSNLSVNEDFMEMPVGEEKQESAKEEVETCVEEMTEEESEKMENDADEMQDELENSEVESSAVEEVDEIESSAVGEVDEIESSEVEEANELEGSIAEEPEKMESSAEEALDEMESDAVDVTAEHEKLPESEEAFEAGTLSES